uniref:Uncharacterized protein n=1 Tax=Picea sitchensis TaxID=3332 RepID=A9NLU1_PICSI|nr:unknown [Picea sitchensis]
MIMITRMKLETMLWWTTMMEILIFRVSTYLRSSWKRSRIGASHISSLFRELYWFLHWKVVIS